MVAQQSGHGFNAVNRGVYIADNLELLRSLNDECIDLVCIDPPFAKNETFAADRLRPRLSQDEADNERRLLRLWGVENASQAAQKGLVWPEGGRVRGGYKDIWSWEDDVHEEWLASLDQDYENISKLIDATRYVHDESVAAYLCYMAIRLLEIHRVLKSDGSLYMHCDHTANGYLRQLLDAIFGTDNFRNEIVWAYNKWSNAGNIWQRNHDSVMFYSKTDAYAFNKQYHITPRKQQSINRGYETNTVAGGKRQLMVYDADKAAAQIAKGDYFDRIIYMDERPEGSAMPDWWTDIPFLNSQARERTGYPTQKPVALAERIIATSSDPGEVVLDCFAGCAYSAVAAERLGRRWLACDFNPRAWTVFKRQFSKPQLAVLDCNDQAPGQQVLDGNPVVTVHGPEELPVRTSPLEETQPKTFDPPERKFKVPASIIPEAEMLEELLKLSGWQAWCCGFANRRPDGSVIETTRNFHLDHIAPKSRENTGRSNDIQNRAPMCPYHNIRKNNRRIGLAEYRQEISDAGEMMVSTMNDLINLDEALLRANQLYGIAYARRNPVVS